MSTKAHFIAELHSSRSSEDKRIDSYSFVKRTDQILELVSRAAAKVLVSLNVLLQTRFVHIIPYRAPSASSEGIWTL